MGNFLTKIIFAAMLLLMAVSVACGGGPTRFERGEVVEGTVNASDASVDGWKSKPYLTEIFENVEYLVRLTSPTGTPVGI